MKKLNNKIHIYIIINIKNDKFYLGSSSNINKRIKTHFRELNKNKHHSIYLQRAYNKYGKKSFIVNILDECETNERLLLEDFYLLLLKPNYNIAKTATAFMQGRKHSIKTKKLMSKRHKGNKYNLGKKHTKEHIQKIINSRIGYRHSKKTKIKMSKTAIKNNQFKYIKPYIKNLKKKIIDSNGNLFNSLIDCSKYWKISPATVCDILKGRHLKTRKGIVFKYA